MKKILLLATVTIALLTSCSKKIDCYECLTQRYNEMVDTHYVTKEYLCDLSKEDITAHEIKSSGKKFVYITWDNTAWGNSTTVEQHKTECKLIN